MLQPASTQAAATSVRRRGAKAVASVVMAVIRWLFLSMVGFLPVLVRLSGIPAEEKVNSITKEQRRALVSLFKNFPVRVSGPRPIDEAIVTSGGVSVREIDPKTMASKLVDGLYFAGEVIDVDAYTGGFNLQIAWSTANAAALAAGERIRET